MKGPEAQSEALERRYRRWLVAYPRTWRISYEQELLAVLMDSAGHHQRRPTLGSVVDLVRNGLAARWRLMGADPVGRLYRDGLALASMAAYTVLAAGSFALLLSALVHPASLVKGHRAVPAAAVAAALFLSSYGLMLADRRKLARTALLAGDALAVSALALVALHGSGIGTPRPLPMAIAIVLVSLATVTVLIAAPTSRETSFWPVVLVAFVVALEICRPWGVAGVTHSHGVAFIKVLVGSAALLTVVALSLGQAHPRFLIAVVAIEVPSALAGAVLDPTIYPPHGQAVVLGTLISGSAVLVLATRNCVTHHAERKGFLPLQG